MDLITIAIAKGRIGEESCTLLKKTGLGDCIDLHSRKLIFEDGVKNIRLIYVKPWDVVTYVENGVTDLGIVGKDIILENDPDIYEILDLGFGKCRFSIAGIKGQWIYRKDDILRVATKYPEVTKRYFSEKQQKINIVKLNGSVELAPLVGLSDVIVDLVETGNTLRENGLQVIEDMMHISARLISNKISYRFKYERIGHIVHSIEKTLEVQND